MSTTDYQPDQSPRKNSNVIYFLIVVIIALLGTDVYLYMKKSNSDERVVTQNDEKTRLQTELDSLEAQVEQVNAGRTRLSADMKAKNDSLQSKIKYLRGELAKGKLTQAELAHAQEDIKQLRYFVTSYTAQIEELKQQNTALATERDTLKTNLTAVSQKAENLTQQANTLQQQNQDLDKKVQMGSALKVGSANVMAYKVRSSGKEVDVTRSSTAKRLKINFTVASNDLAAKGPHDIFVRITDPMGNFITGPGGTFNADGQDMPYTYRQSINFNNDGAPFVIEWENSNPFVKGTYNITLYADGYTMGKTSITLK
jgi:prefoldin subunit 5